MDVVLPGIDGYEATRRLRELPGLNAAAILACSARVSKAQHDETAGAGCTDFLQKPIEASVLLRLLGRHLKLQWTHKTPEVPSVRLAPAEVLCRPPSDIVAALFDLVNKGRVQDLVAQANQLERQDARLGPWLRQACTMAEEFQLKRLRSWLQSEQEAAAAAA